jgi:Cof subfamily protein (haloacid dehalogenase superfamily)
MTDQRKKPVPPGESLKALALDLDGTTLGPGGTLTERTRRVLRALGDRGLQLIIATGRAPEAAEKYRLPLGAEGPLIYFNGAVVADMPSGRILDATLLDPEVTAFCRELSRRRGVYFQVFFPGEGEGARSILMAEQEGPGRDRYFEHTGLLSELGDLEEALQGPGRGGSIKSMFVAEPAVLDALRPELEERFRGEIYLARTLKDFLEVMNPQVSKGTALRRVLQYRGLSPSELIAFGDEENDLPLFAAAGFSAAPANAKEPVKAAADLVIGSNALDGVAVFLEELFGL